LPAVRSFCAAVRARRNSIWDALCLCVAVLLSSIAVAHAAEAPIANSLLLVAKPELSDPNFRETVVLVTQPVPGGGPLGVILNRPLGSSLSKILPDAAGIAAQFDDIYAGGPVAPNQLVYLVRTSDSTLSGLRVLDDVVLNGDRGLAADVARGRVKAIAFRAYAGFCGWVARQLQAEIAQGGWYVLPADVETIFSANAAGLWPELINRITTRSAATGASRASS
jgi:putative transcriptional regulator